MDILKDKKKFNALVKDVFNAIDENDNGYIEFQEIRRAILEMYQNTNVKKMDDKQLSDMINSFDQDENQTLNQDELANLLKQVLEKSVQLQKEEEEKKNKKKADKNEPTSFRSKKITTRDRELQKQELLDLKQELNQLKMQDKKSQQLQNQKLVNFYVNPTAKDEDLAKQQEMFDASSNNSSIYSSSSQKSSKSLNPLVFNQYLRQGFIKSAEDMIKAQQSAKNNHLIGMAVKRTSAGDWQGLVDYFNEQTDKEFDRTPSSQQFHIISKKLSKNVKFILIHIQNLTYTNYKDLRINQLSDLQSVDKPALFYWEVVYNDQTYFKNSAKEFPNQLNECLDSILIYNYTNPIEVILWKKQNKDSQYIGQFDITPSLFQLMRKVTDEPLQGTTEDEQTKYRLNLDKIKKQLRRLLSSEIKLYRKKRISYSKNYQEDPPLIGELKVKFQMFEIFEYDAPQNQLSNVIGSPRSLSERERRMLVEQSKYGPYKWPDDQQNKALVVKIGDASVELAIVNEEDVQSYLDGQLGALIKETFYFDTDGVGSRKTTRMKRPQLSENTIALLKSLDENPLVVQVNNLRQTIRQGRLPKKVLEEALISFGCTGSQLFIDHVDDLGMCEYDYCFDEGNYAVIIDTIQNMEFANPENIQQADSFAEKLVQNIKSTLIEGRKLEPLFEFLKVAEKIPDLGITINLISDQFQHGLGSKTDQDGNVQIDPGSFISYFDINSRDFEKMENYEHIMVLGKIAKLCKKNLKPDDPFLNHIQSNYQDAKSKIYFTVPVLPKKKKLKEKAKLLILQSDNVTIGLFEDMDIKKDTPLSEVKQKYNQKKKEIQDQQEGNRQEQVQEQEQDQVPELQKPCLWNICHELVRRQRWKMFYEGFEAAPEFYYQKGGTGNTPLLDFFEKGPFTVINQVLTQYHPNNPNEDNKDLPKLDSQKIVDMTTPKGKSFVHALALNQDINPQGQLIAMKSLLDLITPELQEQFISMPMKPHDAVPLVLYINKLSSVLPSGKQEDDAAILQILRILKEPLKKSFSQSLFRAKLLFKTYSIDFEQDNFQDYYHNHIQLSKAVAQLQPAIIKLVSEEIDWISWFSLNIEHYNSKNVQLPFAIYNLARQGKLEFLEQLLEDFLRNQSTLQCQIAPDLDFIIAQNQEDFISDENDQITIYNQDKNKTIQFDKEQMLNALAQFYSKYPLEILIGIQQILNDQQFTTLKLNKLLKELIIQTIKLEHRILAKQFYLNKKSPFSELVKLGMEEDLKKILTPKQIQVYQDAADNFAQNFIQDVLSESLQDKENPFLLDHISRTKLLSHTAKLMNEKGLEDVLKLINKLEQYKKENQRDSLIEDLFNQMIRQLPTNFAKSQYPKIFKVLKQNKNKKINSQVKQVLNAALNTNNQQLTNNCLQYLWNKSPQNEKARISSVLRPLYSKYGQFYRALAQHPAVVLNQQDFNKFMEDTKEVATLEDFEIAAKALVKQGMPDRLPIFLKRLAAKKPELVFNLLEDIALNLLDKELRYSPVAPLKPLEGQIQKVQPQFIIPTKRQIILSQYNLIDAGAMGCLLQNAKKLLDKSANFPKSWNTYNHNLNKQAFQQYYQQKLRQNFYSQNPGTIFNNWNSPKPEIEKTVETILEALNDSLDNLLQKKPELKDKLEKISLLPLISNNISIIEKLNKKEERIFKSIENIILQNLKQKASKLELIRIEKRIKGNLQFLEQYFKPNLKTVMEQEKNRSQRILRALDYTLKKEQQQLQLQFATDVVLIIVKNFTPDDFSGIIDNNSSQIFNALAVSLMRSKTIDQRALEFMGSQLNKYQFYDLVFSLSLGEQSDKKSANKQMKEAKIFSSIESIPEKFEIEIAERLVVPSQNNIPYFIKLLKAKVKPFFKSYTKDKNFVDGKAFGLNELKTLNLFEYLIVKCHYTLIQKHYINLNKPKNPLSEEQIIKYLCLASSCGSYILFDLITEQILNLKLPQLYKDYEKVPQFQTYLNLPIFYQVLMYCSEQSSIMFFENIIVESVTLELFYKWMKFQSEEDNISNFNCFVPIINKKYGQLFYRIIQFLRKILKKDQDFYQNLSQIMNHKNFSESQITTEDDEEERLSLLEFSIYQGFPDFCMLYDKNIKLDRNPLKNRIYSFLENYLAKCCAEFKQDDSVLVNYCKKHEKDSKNYRVNHYQIYLVLKKYFQGNQHQLQSLQTSVLLFKVMLQYNQQISSLLYIKKRKPLIEDIQVLDIDSLQFEDQFFHLHLYGVDKILKCQLSISDYVRQFHSKSKVFWVQLDVIEAFKTYFQFDYKKELFQLNPFNLDQLAPKLDQFTSEVFLYIVYNQPSIFQIEQEQPLRQFFIYKYMLPIIRHLSTQDIIQPIESKNLKNKELEQMVEQQQHYYDNIMRLLLIEDVELNYQFAAILVFYISTCNEKINYIGEGDTTIYKINPILLQQLEKLSIQDLDCYVVQLISQIRNNELYEIAIQWTQQSKGAINKDIFKEKTFIQGLINFINKKKKTDNFNFNYQLNDFLKLFQFEFVRSDKLCKDKIYRGLCVIHIALNFILEIENLKEYINQNDQISINIELMEQSKAKSSSIKVLSVKELTEDKELTGFNYQLEMPMVYQERNNIITLFFNSNIVKEFQQIQEKQRFDNFRVNEFQKELRDYSFFLNSYNIKIAIKSNQLQLDNIEIIKLQIQEKYPFYFGAQFSNLNHDIDLDSDIFFDEKNARIFQRKQLTIEDEVNVQSYFDATTNKYEITLNILILKKDQFFSKCTREAQLKLVIDDFQRKQNQLKYIKKFLSDENNNLAEYQGMMELIQEENIRKKDRQYLSEEEKEQLQIFKEKYQNYKIPPYFIYELDWPIYLENNVIYADEYNFPQYMLKKLISIIDDVFSEMILIDNENSKSLQKTILKKDQSYLINYISFIDTLVMQFTKIFELKKKSKSTSLSIEDIAYQALDWPFLKYIMNLIKNKFQKSNLLFEMKESTKPDISLNLPGIDDCVQLSQTNYFYYKGIFIIRLGVFFNKKVLTLDKPENQNLRYSQNFSLNFNLEPYINYILNETQLQGVLKKEEKEQQQG